RAGHSGRVRRRIWRGVECHAGDAMTPGEDYLSKCRELVNTVEAQMAQIRQAADWFAASILAGRMVQCFGSGHSRIMVEEMWPRYGSFPGFNPIVELSLTFHNP